MGRSGGDDSRRLSQFCGMPFFISLTNLFELARATKAQIGVDAQLNNSMKGRLGRACMHGEDDLAITQRRQTTVYQL
jgi:hypothetical protein